MRFFFQNLKFRTRLLLGFSSVLLLTAIAFFLSFYQIQQIGNDTDLIYNHPLAVSNSVKDINIYINAMHRSMKDVALAQNEDQINHALSYVESYDKQVRNAFKIVFEKFLGDKQLVEDAFLTYNSWEEIRNEVIKLKREGKDNEAADITKGKGAKHVELLFEKTKLMTDFAKNKADELYWNTKIKEKNSLLIIVILSFFLFSLSTIISLLISRSISNPIKNFVIQAKQLYKGQNIDFSTETNEQKLLKITINELTETYEKLQNEINTRESAEKQILDQYKEIQQFTNKLKEFNIELEERVLERTKELKQSEEKYRNLFNSTNDAIFVSEYTDKGLSNFIEVNETACKRLGYSRDELLNMNVKHVIDNSIHHVIAPAVDTLLKEKKIIIELIHISKDGRKIPTEINSHIFKLKGKDIILSIARDITDRKRAEQELLRAKEKAEESDSLKSAFLANMSHEIRTPMNGILGFANLLIKPKISKEQRLRYSEIIAKSSDQLLQIINDILDISKIEAKQLKINEEECSVNKILDDLYLYYQSNRKNSEKVELKLAKALSDDNSYIFSDETRLRQILTNLLNNAFKFTSEGFIETGYKLRQGSIIEFHVKDTGPGIPEEKKNIIFNRFSQAEPNIALKYGGTGLGLAISKGLVDLMNGKISFESEQDKGSTFYFSIPFKPVNRIKEEKPRQRKIGKFSWPGKTILIVEDDQVSYEYLSEILIPTGIDIKHISSGSEAVEACLNDPKINLVLMDIRIPGINGNDATHKIKKIRNNLPIFAQTANALPEDRIKSHQAGCDEFISKPINGENLLELIDKYF